MRSMRQGVCDVRRALRWLAARPEVDADRLGVTGISLGGIVSSLVVSVDPRVRSGALLLAGGDLSKVKRIVKLGGFVQAGPDFFDIPKVVNGCSDLMVEVFGDAGRHARSAVGVYRLPLNFSVEVDAVVELA